MASTFSELPPGRTPIGEVWKVENMLASEFDISVERVKTSNERVESQPAVPKDPVDQESGIRKALLFC